MPLLVENSLPCSDDTDIEEDAKILREATVETATELLGVKKGKEKAMDHTRHSNAVRRKERTQRETKN